MRRSSNASMRSYVKNAEFNITSNKESEELGDEYKPITAAGTTTGFYKSNMEKTESKSNTADKTSTAFYRSKSVFFPDINGLNERTKTPNIFAEKTENSGDLNPKNENIENNVNRKRFKSSNIINRVNKIMEFDMEDKEKNNETLDMKEVNNNESDTINDDNNNTEIEKLIMQSNLNNNKNKSTIKKENIQVTDKKIPLAYENYKNLKR